MGSSTDTLTGLFDPPMFRKIDASDGRRGDGFGAENDAGYTPSGGRVFDFDADRTDSGPVLDLFTRRAFGIRGNRLGYRRRLPAEDSVLSDVVDWKISGDKSGTGGCWC
jgi:hypothetical protein